MGSVLRTFVPFMAVFPMACLAAAAIAAMTAEAFREPHERMPIGGLGIVGLVGAGLACLGLWGRGGTAFGVVAADRFGLLVSLLLVLVGLLTVVLSSTAVDRDRSPAGEYYALVLFAIAGMMLMACATDLLVMFLALEVLSLAAYVLTGIRRESPSAIEAAFKYFLLGGFSSAFFLYGIAFTYGVTGSTRLDVVGQALAAQAMSPDPMALAAAGLLLVGFAFKVSAVPFHMWTPDAYEGAPPVVAGFMSTGVKAAAFAAFLRVFLSAFEPLRAEWFPVIWTVAAATMILGTVVAVAQQNLKRMLAYSSIAHGGYMLVALVSANDVGKAAILFYLFSYAVSNIGAFGVIAMLEGPQRPNDELRDYVGLGSTHPGLAAAMTICLLSLGGFPPTAGFIAKWYIFSAAVRSGDYSLALIGVLTSVISVFFYLRIVVMMYMAERAEPVVVPVLSRPAIAALVVSVGIIVYLGVLPTRLLDVAANSVGTIF